MGTLCLRKGSFVVHKWCAYPSVHLLYGSTEQASVSNIKFDKKTRQNRSLRLLVVLLEKHLDSPLDMPDCNKRQTPNRMVLSPILCVSPNDRKSWKA